MRIKSISVTAFMLAVLAACGKPAPEGGTVKEGTVTLDKEEISLSYEAQSTTVTVDATCDWGVTSEDSWVKVSPSGGVAGKSSFKVTVEENKTGDVRVSDLLLKYGSSRKEVPVRQNYKVEKVEISDAAFKAYLLKNFDSDKDGVLSTKEAAAVTKIEASGLGIKAMPEIATAFPNLTWLDCSDNQLTELPVEKLTGLTHLDCSGNNLSTLDITLLGKLETFDATGNNALTAIYVWSDFKAPAGFSKPDSARYVEPEITTPAGYQLVWRDEFNDPSLIMPDTKDWWYETAGPGWVNNEKQTYVAGRKGDIITADVSKGTLKIHLVEKDGEYLSARVNTKQGWTYGYFEARLKLPKGLGTWPAFWMMPTEGGNSWPSCGEIDIMEHVGADLNQVSSSIHCKAYYHAINTQKTKARYLKGATDEFHVYALEWTPEYIRSFVDGEQLFYYNPDDYSKGRNADTWPFNKPFQLKLNLAWGGDWGGYKGMDYDCLPQTYEIDYVRVFQKP